MFLFYWLIAILPLEQHDLWGRVLFGNFTVIKLLGLAVFLYALGYACWKGRWPSFRGPMACSVLVFISLQVANYFFHVADLQNFWMAYSHVISILILFISSLILIDSRRRLHWSLLAALGAVAFVSLHVLRQWQLYRGTFVGFRPGGMLADSNYYALVAGLWIPLAFLWSMNQGRPKWERLYCFGCLMVALAGSMVASSRGGFLGLMTAFAWIIWQSPHRVRNTVLAGVLIVPISVWFPGSPLRRLTDPSSGDNGGKEARLVAWRAGIRMIEAHPLAGVGLQNFRPEMERYEGQGEEVISLAHNTYIELTAELGVFGGLAFVGVFATVFIRLERVRRRAVARRCQYLATTALALQAGVLSFVVSAVFLSAWWDKMTWLLVCACVCLERTAPAWFREAARRSSRASATRRPESRHVHDEEEIVGAVLPDSLASPQG